MSPNHLRCRHYNVDWIDSHSCQCKSCGKFGHWFENQGLVMWVRDDPKSAVVRKEVAPVSFVRIGQTAVANRAG